MIIYCVKANQSYIDMLYDFASIAYKKFIENIADYSYFDSNNYVTSEDCWNSAVVDSQSIFYIQQRLIKHKMRDEYKHIRDNNLAPRGLMYLVNRRHEYLVFANQHIAVNPRTYTSDFRQYEYITYDDSSL